MQYYEYKCISQKQVDISVIVFIDFDLIDWQ